MQEIIINIVFGMLAFGYGAHLKKIGKKEHANLFFIIGVFILLYLIKLIRG